VLKWVPMRRWAIATSAVLGLAVLIGSGASPAQTPAPPAASAGPAQAAPPAAGSAGAAAPAAEGTEAKKPAPGVTGGYSWTEKPAPQRKRRARIKLDPNAPLATYPGFRMASDGTSRVWLRVTRSADVQVRRAAGQVTYVLGGVHVGVRNNTNALVTTHFNTPLARARLVPDRAGALLVLELRETVEPTHKVSTGPHGMMLLEITLPRAQRLYADRFVPSQGRTDQAIPAAAVPPRGRTP
jgi:hypothetical protein